MAKRINQMSSSIKNRNLTLAPIKEHKQDTKPDIKLNKERKQDVKPNIEFDKESKHDTYEEEKVALVLGITSIFTAWWLFK